MSHLITLRFASTMNKMFGMSFENHEAKDYGHDLELAIIKNENCLSQATRSGCKAEGIDLSHAYFLPKTNTKSIPKIM